MHVFSYAILKLSYLHLPWWVISHNLQCSLFRKIFYLEFVGMELEENLEELAFLAQASYASLAWHWG